MSFLLKRFPSFLLKFILRIAWLSGYGARFCVWEAAGSNPAQTTRLRDLSRNQLRHAAKESTGFPHFNRVLLTLLFCIVSSIHDSFKVQTLNEWLFALIHLNNLSSFYPPFQS